METLNEIFQTIRKHPATSAFAGVVCAAVLEQFGIVNIFGGVS